MSDLRARLKPLFRRSSTFNSAKSSVSSVSSIGGDRRGQSKTSLLLAKNRKPSGSEPVPEDQEESTVQLPFSPHIPEPDPAKEGSQNTPNAGLGNFDSPPLGRGNPVLQVQEPTPKPEEVSEPLADTGSQSKAALLRPAELVRTQSLAHSSQNRFLSTLLETEKPPSQIPNSDYFHEAPILSADMLHSKIWVKRTGASATRVLINEDDLVDDVRDIILRKYANALGRTFDAPDVTIRIIPRQHAHQSSQGERTLGPEEPISRTLDAYFPGGQSVEEALIIDVPQRRTPKHSPRAPLPYYLAEDLRPGESGTEYFPLMPAAGQHSPHLSAALTKTNSGLGTSHHQPVHSIAILNTGQPPPLPSPSIRGIRHAHTGPIGPNSLKSKHLRTHTTSPPILTENLKAHTNAIPVAPPLPNPTLPTETAPHRATTPSPRAASPRPKVSRRRPKKPSDGPQLPAGLLDGAVPPINVLIVEDNIINLKLLEAFLKRLKVRWKTAMNGREAVTKWRGGGFHLVLMDIQLPVMNGLDATKEIRRLERLNKIGVMSDGASNAAAVAPDQDGNNSGGKPEGDDYLTNRNLFKSPVIIVALTASSLQSDRHEALAAGCNDFLTKPVNFVWLERKVMEWGCMQALIDFDGWRKWKDFSSASTTSTTTSQPQPQPQPSSSSTNSTSPTIENRNKISTHHHKQQQQPNPLTTTATTTTTTTAAASTSTGTGNRVSSVGTAPIDASGNTGGGGEAGPQTSQSTLSSSSTAGGEGGEGGAGAGRRERKSGSSTGSTGAGPSSAPSAGASASATGSGNGERAEGGNAERERDRDKDRDRDRDRERDRERERERETRGVGMDLDTGIVAGA